MEQPAVRTLADADNADTAAVLRAARDAERAAQATAAGGQADEPAGQLPPPDENVRLALGELATALGQAPSLPPPRAAAAPGIRDGGEASSYILFLAALLNETLAEAAARVASPDDRTVLYRAAAAARNLACCYDEGLRPGLAEAAAGVALGR